ncbi:MAG: hypothetical protein OES79_06860 [Planctomycetota bacterium]|nr:hypothetical protein [Planctomycetota bacterium]
MNWLLCGLILLSLPGCSGCRQDADARKKAAEARKKLAEKKEKEKKKPKPNFEFSLPRVVPHDDQPVQRIKPGHWVSVSQRMRANNFDFQGQTTWVPLGKSGRPLPLDRTGYRMSLSRPLSLPKKQQNRKRVEMVLFAPAGKQRRSTFSMNLTDRGGRRHESRPESFGLMEAHEYLFVVLAREPARYGYLKVQNSVQPPSAGDMTPTRMVYYHVLLPKLDERVPLPTSMLTATSIAYILWDDLDPDAMSGEQQDALVDWLHWGGQLLISGPNSLDTLRGSFLEPFLPALGDESIELTSEDLDLLNKEWTAPFAELQNRPLRALRPWSGVKLQLPNSGPSVNVTVSSPRGLPLVVERRVGRGRVVVSAFRFSEHDLIYWPGFDGFLNGCLLRRPPRKFSKGDFGNPHVDWVSADGIQHVRFDRRDPRTVTKLRLFSRDTGYRYDPPPEPADENFDGDTNELIGRAPSPGIGGWNDFNLVSNAARETVREAAGIEIPSASFVLWVLVAYLVVLVPLNWTTFRLMGRIEWAWIAAPVISLACAGVVIKLAQLDIGFARSNTEIAVIETQADYPRAHVTRFNALYTSLSTPYTVTLDDPDALVQPFAVDAGYVQPLGTTPTTVECHRGADVTLTGFHVLSNRTGLIHSEQMLGLGGGISVAGGNEYQISVTNGTDYNLQRAALVRRRGSQDLEIAWLDQLLSAQTATAVFEAVQRDRLRQRWTVGDDGQPRGVELDLWPIIETALQVDEFESGEVRLIALALDQPLPGVTISPSAPQKRVAAVFVAHLQYPQLPPPQRDFNTAAQFQPKPLAVDGERDDNVNDQPVDQPQ